MDILSGEFLSALAAIIVIDLVLAGDNAIVIALAARNLPAHLQKRAIVWGTAGAIIVRSAMDYQVAALRGQGSVLESLPLAIDVRLQGPLRIRNSQAEVDVTGTVTANGTLAQPVATGQVSLLAGGQVTVRRARVRVQDPAVPSHAATSDSVFTIIPASLADTAGPVLAGLALLSVGPTPARAAVRVSFALPDAGAAAPVRIELLDLSGRRVRSLELRGLEPGLHEAELDGIGELPPGLFVVRLSETKSSD